MKVFLITVALFCVTVAEVADFRKCDESSDDICEVTEVRVNPCKNRSRCKLQKGKESNIQFDFIPKFNADKLTSSLFGEVGSTYVLFDDFADVDACPYTTCPTRAGEKQTLSYSLRIRPKLPNGSFTFKWKLWDSNDVNATNSCCFLTDVKLYK